MARSTPTNKRDNRYILEEREEKEDVIKIIKFDPI